MADASQNDALRAEIVDLREQLDTCRQLVNQVMAAEDQGRRRIAQLIHDDSLQTLLEGHGMERKHRLAQARDRRLDHLVRPLHLSPARRGLDQVLVGGEQRLQRIVVDQLGDPPPALILGLHHLGDELPAGRELGA